MNDRIAAAVKEQLEAKGITADVQAVSKLKINGTKKTGLAIKKEGEAIAPIFYIDDLMVKIEDGRATVEEAAEAIAEMYQVNETPNFEAADFQKKEFILANVKYELINRARNKEALETVPSKNLLDLAAVYRCKVGESDQGTMSFMVTNDMMKYAGIMKDELDAHAIINTYKEKYTIKSMREVLAEMIGAEFVGEPGEDENPMYVLTNESKQRGASVLMRNDLLEDLANRLGSDLYILPSSIHEVLAVPADRTAARELKAIVGEVNEQVVANDEILSGSVYKYSRETGTLTIA